MNERDLYIMPRECIFCRLMRQIALDERIMVNLFGYKKYRRIAMEAELKRRFVGIDSFVPRNSVVVYVRPHCLKLDGELYSLVRYQYAKNAGIMFYAKEMNLLTIDMAVSTTND